MDENLIKIEPVQCGELPANQEPQRLPTNNIVMRMTEFPLFPTQCVLVIATAPSVGHWTVGALHSEHLSFMQVESPAVPPPIEPPQPPAEVDPLELSTLPLVGGKLPLGIKQELLPGRAEWAPPHCTPSERNCDRGSPQVQDKTATNGFVKQECKVRDYAPVSETVGFVKSECDDNMEFAISECDVTVEPPVNENTEFAKGECDVDVYAPLNENMEFVKNEHNTIADKCDVDEPNKTRFQLTDTGWERRTDAVAEYPCGKCGKKLRSVYELRWHLLLEPHGSTCCDEVSSSPDKTQTTTQDNAGQHASSVQSPTTPPPTAKKSKNNGQIPAKQSCREEVFEMPDTQATTQDSAGQHASSVQSPPPPPPTAKKRKKNNQAPVLAKPFVCNVCRAGFTQREYLTKHQAKQSHHTCPVCPTRTFPNSFCLSAHKRAHAKERPFECNVCANSFDSREALGLHRRRHHSRGRRTGRHVCEVCRKIFDTKTGLVVHQSSHTMSKIQPGTWSAPNKGSNYRHRCDECDARFQNKRKLIIHMSSHTGVRPGQTSEFADGSYRWPQDKTSLELPTGDHNIETCEVDLFYTSNLAEHSLTHQQKPFSCEACKTEFLTSSGLEAHNRLTHQQKRFVSDTCEKEFVSVSEHRLTHQRKPFSCEACKTEFLTSSGLEAHNRLTHQPKPFVCDWCKREFVSVSDLAEHARTHEVKANACDMCKKEFITATGLEAHNRRTHQLGHNMQGRVR